MREQFTIKQLPNGLTLLGQKMEGVSSASMSLLMTAGASHDPTGAEGAASVGSEWMLRGAGGRDTRQLNDLLDGLGCQHDEAVQSEHLHLSTAQLGSNLHQILEIYRDIVRCPNFDDDSFEPCRDLTVQDLASMEDEPARKCNMLLREKFYPHPLGRCVFGYPQTLEAMKPDLVRTHLREHLTPHEAILSVAGNIDWDNFVAAVEKHLGDWPAHIPPLVRATATPTGETHIQKETAQTHIAFASKSVTMDDERYYAARMAETILSGGMSSRLLTEVREKRGLVYSIGCRYHTLKDHAGMFTYAGTRPEVAQQTFEVTINEMRRMAQGVTQDELARARTQLKASLVMQGESTPSRANSLASDWYHLRRLRGLDEISDTIDQVRADDVTAYVKDLPPDPQAVLVIGPEPLKL